MGVCLPRLDFDAVQLWDDPGYMNLANYAWYYDNRGGTTHPVGQKLPNPWGLYDMDGNVWEWCQDWYDAGYYQNSPIDDPPGPEKGEERVVRGSVWAARPGWCRSASRFTGSPTDSPSGCGFRVVCAPKP